MPRLQNLEAFIEQNAPFLTIGDLAEESGWPQPVVKRTCDYLGIKPISVTDQHKQYIMALYKRKSPMEIAKRLNLSLTRLRKLYKELKIPFQNPSFEATKPITIRDIFAAFSNERILGHYNPVCTD